METPLGWMPRPEDINADGLPIDEKSMRELQSINGEDVKSELLSQQELFLKLGGDMPKEMIDRPASVIHHRRRDRQAGAFYRRHGKAYRGYA